MSQTTTIPKTVIEVFKILSNEGVVVLPSKLGYGILAISNKGVDKLYELKERPLTKPSEIELLCKTYRPELHHKICARMTWRMWRKS